MSVTTGNGFRSTVTAAARPAAQVPSATVTATATSISQSNGGFRRTAFRRAQSASKAKAPKTGHTDTHTSLTAQVIDAATHGQTPRMIAQSLGQPLDLVDLIIERERAAGRITIYDLTSCNSTTGAGCNPDPESMVCASCPILPRQIRKNQSIFAKLRLKARRR